MGNAERSAAFSHKRTCAGMTRGALCGLLTLSHVWISKIATEFAAFPCTLKCFSNFESTSCFVEVARIRAAA